MDRIKTIILFAMLLFCYSAVVQAEQTEQFKKDFQEYKSHYNFYSIPDTMYTMQTEFKLPAGYNYMVPSDSLSYAYWIAHFPIWHQYKTIGQWKGGIAKKYDEISRAVHLPWKGVVFKDVAIPVRILGEYCIQMKKKENFHVTPSKGEAMTYQKWLAGKAVYNSRGEVIFKDDIPKEDTEEEYYKFLLFCMSNVNFKSIAKSCDSVDTNNLQAGDMYIGYDERGKKGKLFVIMNVISNKDGDKMYVVANGCPEACDFHIQKFNDNRDMPWIDLHRLESLTSEFKYSNFYRFKK